MFEVHSYIYVPENVPQDLLNADGLIERTLFKKKAIEVTNTD